MKSTWPPNNAVTPGPSPSNGTAVAGNLVTVEIMELTVKGKPPVPVEPCLTLPGLACTSANKSLKVFQGLLGVVTTSTLPRPMMLTG